MPSGKRNRTRTSRSSLQKKASTFVLPSSHKSQAQSIIFWPVVLLSLILWVIYRVLFDYPVWFDETIGKAVFFGLPVWLYVAMSRNMAIPDSFATYKIKQGLLQGIAFGGIYGFFASLVSLATSGSDVEAALLFTSNAFWWEFFLALMTGFWETLFFFSFVMTVIQANYRSWPLINQVLLTSLVFIVFHLPNVIALFAGYNVVGYLFLIWAFGMGQAFIYARNQNAYALVVSHAIWGMVLLVHMQ